MRQLNLVVAACLLLALATAAYGQRIDLGFGAGTVTGPSSSVDSFGNIVAPSYGRGTYLGFNGNVLFFHNMGVNAEVSWRASRANYPIGAGFSVPYRPLFYDFNAIWAPKYDRIGPELMAGIGAESLRFYTGTNCGSFSCTNYQSINHFAGHFGGGVKLYVKGNFFVRPEAHLYLVRNNQEFSGGKIGRYGASIGYSFGGQ